MNYALEILAARQRRDAEIRRLKAQNPSLSCAAIGRLVGCAKSTVREVLNPDAREAHYHHRRELAKERARRIEARDQEIWRLHTGDPPVGTHRIVRPIGCSPSLVYEVLHPARREEYNRRRRAHWRVYAGERAA